MAPFLPLWASRSYSYFYCGISGGKQNAHDTLNTAMQADMWNVKVKAAVIRMLRVWNCRSQAVLDRLV